eukprot:CAMPEP_0172797680 /NCGR_PEP_ID=MMETSP1075-20121228/585_1 /TAXON_ID=2916 /ORGANISM="Ceratium fusus, Strain PA161109" /LENGTH=171 /DNA_ID=CAMNT_0013634969 /DNA_START=338 /DNA_END=853 /DNA_ORIENTATION=+
MALLNAKACIEVVIRFVVTSSCQCSEFLLGALVELVIISQRACYVFRLPAHHYVDQIEAEEHNNIVYIHLLVGECPTQHANNNNLARHIAYGGNTAQADGTFRNNKDAQTCDHQQIEDQRPEDCPKPRVSGPRHKDTNKPRHELRERRADCHQGGASHVLLHLKKVDSHGD